MNSSNYEVKYSNNGVSNQQERKLGSTSADIVTKLENEIKKLECHNHSPRLYDCANKILARKHDELKQSSLGAEYDYINWIAKVTPLIEAFNCYKKSHIIDQKENAIEIPSNLIDIDSIEKQACRLLEMKDHSYLNNAKKIQDHLADTSNLVKELNYLKVVADSYKNKEPNTSQAKNKIHEEDTIFQAATELHKEGYNLARQLLEETDENKRKKDCELLSQTLSHATKSLLGDRASFKPLKDCAAAISGKPNHWRKFFGVLCIVGAALSIALGITFAIPTFGIGLAAGIGGAIGLFLLAKSKKSNLSQKASDLSSTIRNRSSKSLQIE